MNIGILKTVFDIASKYQLDGVDLAILADIAYMREKKGAATIMLFSDGTIYASFATIHARVSRMVENGILVRRPLPKNRRVKALEDGPQGLAFYEDINSVYKE
jgi:hypothetical protein